MPRLRVRPRRAHHPLQPRVRGADRPQARGGARPRRARDRHPAGGRAAVRPVPGGRLGDRQAVAARRRVAHQGRLATPDLMGERAGARRRRRGRVPRHDRPRHHRARAPRREARQARGRAGGAAAGRGARGVRHAAGRGLRGRRRGDLRAAGHPERRHPALRAPVAGHDRRPLLQPPHAELRGRRDDRAGARALGRARLPDRQLDTGRQLHRAHRRGRQADAGLRLCVDRRCADPARRQHVEER